MIFKNITLLWLLLLVSIIVAETSQYVEIWDSTQAYNGGRLVKHDDVIYLAKWWNKGVKPSSDTIWIANPNIYSMHLPWNESKGYNEGDIVTYYGEIYIARYWSKNNIPDKSGQYGAWVSVKFKISDNLPPDPGKEGLSTIAGIDSDNDGVRDDLQRIITFYYTDSPEQRAAVMQVAKSLQSNLLEYIKQKELGTQHIYIDSEPLVKAIECVYSVGAFDKDFKIGTLEAYFANTSDRFNMYNALNKTFEGSIIGSTPDEINPCDCELLEREKSIQEQLK